MLSIGRMLRQLSVDGWRRLGIWLECPLSQLGLQQSPQRSFPALEDVEEELRQTTSSTKRYEELGED